MSFTAVFVECPEGGFSAFVEEIPGVNTQGVTLAEARENLADALRMVLEANREISRRSTATVALIREPLELAGASS